MTCLMKSQQIVACIATVFVTSCSAHGASGTYVARGRGFVEMLQLTQAQDGQLLGSLASTALKPDGSITQGATNISGVADGHAITLVAKAPIPLIPSLNISGTIAGGVITVTNPTGQEQFNASSPSDYQAAVQQLRAQGAAIQQQQHVLDENAGIADLNKKLIDYATLVRQPKADEQLASFHAEHTKALERARHGLESEQNFPKGSFKAGQVAFAVGQIQFRLQSYDNNWNGIPEQGRTHIRQFDTAISQSLCRAQENLANCAQQPAAVQAYQASRTLVLRRGDDIEATLKSDDAAMKVIVAQAQAYSTN